MTAQHAAPISPNSVLSQMRELLRAIARPPSPRYIVTMNIRSISCFTPLISGLLSSLGPLLRVART
jgi:hypothetical protein